MDLTQSTDPAGRGPNKPPSASQTVRLNSSDASGSRQPPTERFPQIEGYNIVERIDHGGMGVVYRAVQIKLNRAVALKVLPTLMATPKAVERFRREASAAARLHHTHIVPIHDFGESPDGYYYSMELIDGNSLNRLIKYFADENVVNASAARMAGILSHIGTRGGIFVTDSSSGEHSVTDSTFTGGTTARGRPYFQQVAMWMADAADALHYAHTQRIIHRDIKPGNLILSSDGRIMITDFGLARSEGSDSLTITGAFLGSLRYVSPEQAMAKRIRVDHRTDIYSLGATMYELLTFQPAFPGEDEKEILAQIVTKDPVPPRKIVPTISEELETICLKALEKAADDRYATARAMAEDLRCWMSDLPIAAKRPGLVRRGTKFVRRNRAMTTAAVAAVLLAASTALTLHLDAKSKASQVQQLSSAAQLAENKGLWSDASAAWRDALKIDSENAFLLSRLARSLQELHDRLGTSDSDLIEEAIGNCEKSRALMSDDKLDNLYGVLLAMRRRDDEALAIFNQLVASHNKVPWVWINFASVYFLQNNDEKVWEALEKSVANPKLGDRPYCYGYRGMAAFLLMKSDREALKVWDTAEACQGEPTNHFADHLMRARVLLTMSNPESMHAVCEAEAASSHWKEAKKDRYIERYLALAYLRSGEWQKALHAATRALDAGDMEAYAKMIIAGAHAGLGNRAIAETTFNEAKAAWPADLREPGAIRRSLHLGSLWFESADELLALERDIKLGETN